MIILRCNRLSQTNLRQPVQHNTCVLRSRSQAWRCGARPERAGAGACWQTTTSAGICPRRAGGGGTGGRAKGGEAVRAAWGTGHRSPQTAAPQACGLTLFCCAAGARPASASSPLLHLSGWRSYAPARAMLLLAKLAIPCYAPAAGKQRRIASGGNSGLHVWLPAIMADSVCRGRGVREDRIPPPPAVPGSRIAREWQVGS